MASDSDDDTLCLNMFSLEHMATDSDAQILL